MAGRHVYHYHVFFKNSGRTETHIDGIALLLERVTGMDDYRALKKLIADDVEGMAVEQGQIVVSSLSYLGTE